MREPATSGLLLVVRRSVQLKKGGMMKSICTGLFSACIVMFSAASLSGQSLINEFAVDPPGTDVPCEYVEFKGTPNTQLRNLYFVSVSGDVELVPGGAG